MVGVNSTQSVSCKAKILINMRISVSFAVLFENFADKLETMMRKHTEASLYYAI